MMNTASQTQSDADTATQRATPRGVLVWIGVLGLSAGLGYLVLRSSVDLAIETNCSIGLRRIGLALQEYHDLHGSFPPAWVADANGNPMHSWRALILESWLETTFEISNFEYKFDEPWDSPANRALLEDFPTGLAYQCPLAETSDLITNYVMIVGEGLLSDGTGATTTADITDGLAETIAVVEVHNSGIEWTEPRDLSIDELVEQINGDSAHSISSPHAGGALVLMADGTTRFLEEGLPPDELKSLLTIAGGD